MLDKQIYILGVLNFCSYLCCLCGCNKKKNEREEETHNMKMEQQQKWTLACDSLRERRNWEWFGVDKTW
jgi:hypothetical protein